MPMEFGLELMAVVRPDFADAEWELVDDVVDEFDRVCLSMFFVILTIGNTTITRGFCSPTFYGP